METEHNETKALQRRYNYRAYAFCLINPVLICSMLKALQNSQACEVTVIKISNFRNLPFLKSKFEYF